MATRFAHRLPAIVALGACALLAAGCGTSSSSQASSTTAAATSSSSGSSATSSSSKPKQLVFYSAQGYDQAEATAFQKATGITVKLDDMSTGPLLAKVAAEGSHPQWDVIWFDGNGPMASLDQKGALMTGYNPPNAKYYDSLGQKLLPKDHAYFPTGTTAAAAIVYNKNKLSASQVPKTWSDLLKPQYANKIGMNNPAISGPTYPFVYSILQEMGTSKGKQFFKTLKAHGLQIFSDNGHTLKALQSGKINLAMVQDSAILSLIAKGSPVGIDYPTDGVAMLPSDMAISKNGPDPKAAQMFVNFVLSQQGQKVMATEGGGDSLYAPILTDAIRNKNRPQPTTPINWVTVNPVTAGQQEASINQWFTQNIVH